MRKPGENSTDADPRQDYLERVARTLADAHAPGNLTTRRTRASRLPTAFDTQFEQIFAEIGALDPAALDKLPGIDWLLDNDYVIQEAIAILKEGRLGDGYRRLPTLTTAPRRGELRVLALADEIVNVCGTPIELDWVKRFVAAYQIDSGLTLGELWALPNMLRYVALDRLANTTQSLLSTAKASPGAIPDHSEAIASYIIDLRGLNVQDWNAFIESVSQVHRTLRLDPARAYEQMDAATRNRYRHQVEVIARRTGCPESIVARQAVTLSEDLPSTATQRLRHVGYYLIDDGVAALITALNQRQPWSFTVPNWIRQRMAWWYLGGLASITATAMWSVAPLFPPGRLLLALILPVALVLLLTLGTSVVHWLAGLWRKPRTLPKLDFSSGVPAEWTTAVVTPAMLTSQAEIEHLTERLEKNYLGNPDPALRYVLLTDFIDASSMHREDDADLLAHATDAVESLNAHYGTGLIRPFFLYHRQREWNEREACYMAKERKRGKLGALNRLLLGDREAERPLLVGSAEHLRAIRFVITLDADTQLPPGVANALIGTLAHPLNQPVLEGPRVVNGYNIIQPRLEVDPEVANSNSFTRAFAGDVVVDLYSHAVSNVYQDLFGVGIFAGKGIYDVHAFERSLEHRVPDNSILSHDLFEGLHGRVGLATDIVLFEDYPTNLLAYERRAHRWTRGDWQLLPWLAPFVPSERGWIRTRFSVLDRWKMIENLHRSLFPLATLLALVAAWTVLPGHAWLWTLGIVAVSGAPIALSSVRAVGSSVAQGGTPRALIERLNTSLQRDVARWLFLLVLLPYESLIAVDAVARTLWRLAVTRRHLLQWQPAAVAVRQVASRMSARYVWQQMLAAPSTAVIVGAWLVWWQPTALWSAGPFLIAWLLAPQIAIRSMRPPKNRHDEPPITERQRRSLHKVALRTWQFFAHFVGPENHWLPPDNYHEAPEIFASKRTSPTNIGLMLLATLAAYDFGYLSLNALTTRLRHTLESLRKMERYRGHLLNWYRIDNLTALEPRYVSAVDSGNLAASLLTLKNALLEIEHEPIDIARLKSGTVDVVHELADTLRDIGVSDALQSRVDALIEALSSADSTTSWCALIATIELDELPAVQSMALESLDSRDNHLAPEALAALRRSFGFLQGQLQSCRRECLTLIPWCLWPEALGASSEVERSFGSIRDRFSARLDVASMPEHYTDAADALGQIANQLPQSPSESSKAILNQLNAIREELSSAAIQAQLLQTAIQALVSQTDALLAAMDFSFLYDPDRHLLRLGYTVTTAEFDPNHYDLLASEARLASFVGIVKGDLPPEHWVHLGRPFTRIGNKRALASWSATAFEYLMPHLLMRAPDASLLAESCRLAVARQRAFAKELDVPWGISESGFYQLDKQAHYQYRAFGVPGLGLRAEQRFRAVIAPYASMLALPFSVQSVMSNLAVLQGLNMLGRFGLFEAIDFGYSDAGGPRRGSIVRSYMSHHQGMIMAALDNALLGEAMVRRFHADPGVASHAYLLFEQSPRGTATKIGWRDRSQGPPALTSATTLQSWSIPSATKVPQLNVLSNGHYQTMLNHYGVGASFFDGLCLTRWGSDRCDQEGTALYIRDLDSDILWSACERPIKPTNPDDCDTRFFPHMAEFHRRDHGIHIRVEATVAAKDDVEIRRITLTNDTDRPRRLELVSYAEPVLSFLDDHERHPTFSKLFIEVSALQPEGVLVARRRRRDTQESPVYLAHGVCEFGQRRQPRTAYLDRREFLGRWGSLRAPAKLVTRTTDDNPPDAGLDPAMGLGIEVDLPARGVTQLAFICAAGRSRADVMQNVADYQSEARLGWAFHQARLAAERLLGDIGVEPAEVAGMLELLSSIYACDPRLRASPAHLQRSHQIQSILWSRGVSGDLPIVMAHVRGLNDVKTAEQLVRTHLYWDRHQIAIDVVILDDEMGGYAQPTRTRLARLVEEARSRWRHYAQGNIYIVPTAELGEDDRQRILAAAWLILDPAKGTIAEQLAVIRHLPPGLPPFVPMPSSPITDETTPALERPSDLQFDNGLGGFSPDSREYVIFISDGQTTPAPWSNVIANPNFGFLITESGASTTWAGNSGENRLTPWHNDPVRDLSGEAVFLRDEETGAVWSPTPRPNPDAQPYEIRHGMGYTCFEHISHGLRQSVTAFADTADPVKIISLRLSNCWRRPRRITVTYYAEWVLGLQRTRRSPHVASELDDEDSVLYAWNTFEHDGSRTAFLTSNLPIHGATTDRLEFLGADDDPARPAALYRIGLSGEVSPAADPCAALQVHLDIEPGATVEMHFVLGQGQDRNQARDLARRYRDSAEAGASLARVNAHWNGLLNSLQVTTPDRALDLMTNGWLLYQALSCRLWGRTAMYQSGGGFGFRDQLQDAMAFTVLRPDLTRRQIIRAASVQFYRGDVLHWWHDDPLRGVRTRCSDDMLWLPYVAAHYVSTTDDVSVLDERVSYLDGEILAPEESERYAEFTSTHIAESVYDHCIQAIEHAAAKIGPHGLPLIGSGDWNDGLSRVGSRGRGESVWLGWFLVVVFRDFAAVCERRGNSHVATDYRARADALAVQIDAVAWDGEWYLRAYDDDGHPVGSASNEECKIDLNAQTWAVLAEAPDSSHRIEAMRSLERWLMDDRHVLRLLSPPFEHGDSDPGYIKGYPPGVRENGAQYSHAAAWAGFAYTALGDGNRALDVVRCLNPINHADSAAAAATYWVEPYVVAADIYAEVPYFGRGGWTWYTGAAAWTHRLIVERILGIQRRGDIVEISPCLPDDWDGYQARLRLGEDEYLIKVVHAGPREYHIYANDLLVPDGRLSINVPQVSHDAAS